MYKREHTIRTAFRCTAHRRRDRRVAFQTHKQQSAVGQCSSPVKSHFKFGEMSTEALSISPIYIYLVMIRAWYAAYVCVAATMHTPRFAFTFSYFLSSLTPVFFPSAFFWFYVNFSFILRRFCLENTTRKMDNTQSQIYPLYMLLRWTTWRPIHTRILCGIFLVFFSVFATHFFFSIAIRGEAGYNKMYVLVHRFLFCTCHFARFVTLTTNFCLEHWANGEEHLVFGAVLNYRFLWNFSLILIRVQLKSVFQFFLSISHVSSFFFSRSLEAISIFRWLWFFYLLTNAAALHRRSGI